MRFLYEILTILFYPQKTSILHLLGYLAEIRICNDLIEILFHVIEVAEKEVVRPKVVCASIRFKLSQYL